MFARWPLPLDAPLVGLSAAAILLLRTGQVAVAAGGCRAKNSAGVVLRGVAETSASLLAFWAIGAALLLAGGGSFLGCDGRLLFGADLGRDAGSILFFALLASLASGVVSGAMAERSRFCVTLAAATLLAAVVVPVAGHWATRGWLGRLGFFDPAGVGWIHLAAAAFAAVGAWAVGPREGKYHRDGSSSMIPGHSLPLAGLGALLMGVGWIPYVVLCAAWAGRDGGEAAFNVALSASAGALAAMAVGWLRFGKPDVPLTLLGSIGALVASASASAVVAPIWAVVIGVGAGAATPLAAIWIDLYAHVDDPGGVIAVHGAGGLWGLLAIGLFAPGGFRDRLEHLGVQALGAAAFAALAVVCAGPLFAGLKKAGLLRSSDADQFDGLDLAEHDVAAYPDFQQNTIRSYHLREV